MGYFYKYTCSDRCINLCILQDACHELFCFFGDFHASGMQGAFHSTQNSRNFGWLEQNIIFGLVLPEYWGPALKVVHFDRSGYLVRSDQNVPFHLTKLLSPVQLFCILLTRTITKCVGVWVGSVQLECTGIFVEWKVPLVSVPGSQQHIPTLKFVKTPPPPHPAPMHLIPRHQEVPGKLKKDMVHPRFIYRPTGRCLTKTIYEWFKKFAHCLETLKLVKHSHSLLFFFQYLLGK